MCLLYDGSTRRLTESGFMEKPGNEPATPGLQGIALMTTPRLLKVKEDLSFDFSGCEIYRFKLIKIKIVSFFL